MMTKIKNSGLRRKIIPFGIIIFILLSGTAFKNPERSIYDFFNDNETVVEEKQIMKILSEFERVSFSQLPEDYKKKTGMNSYPFNQMLAGKIFYKLNKSQAMKKIIGHYRIIDFLSKEDGSWKPYFLENKEIYWLVDPQALAAFLRLKKEMKKLGLNWNKLKITSAHRTPDRNKKVGGASQSRHIFGEAIDFQVGDVDGNRFTNEEDKKKVLELCEKIIGRRGGIGLYPETQALHIDTRGYRARWNSY